MMKKMMIALMSMLTFAATGNAMSYEQARNEALFLTDKMAYELNLTEEQYEAVYEINLDYLMGVTSVDDVYAVGWERRNADLAYVLFDWQLSLFRAASYFLRPLYWDAGFWHFAVYTHYPQRDYFYFGRPVFYASYRGAHSWRRNGNRSWYQPHRHVYAPSHHPNHFGMKDRWNRGDFRHGKHGVRNSSTRTTVNRTPNNHHNNIDRKAPARSSSLGGYRSRGSNNSVDRSVSRPSDSKRSSVDNRRSSVERNRSSVDNKRSVGSSSSRSTDSGRSFSSRSSRSVSSGSSNHGGGRSTGGGHSYGGRR